MELKNGYKKVYETADGMFATKNIVCDPKVDTELTEGMLNAEVGNGIFVYEHRGKIYFSDTGIPKYNEEGDSLDPDSRLLDKVTIEGYTEPAAASLDPEDDPVTNTNEDPEDEPTGTEED